MKYAVLFVLSVLCVGGAAAQQALTPLDITQLFAEANQAYRETRYEQAAQLYEQIIAAGYTTADMYFNAGNAYYKSGALGKAILKYRIAHLRAPRDEDVQMNLTYALEQTKDKIECPDTYRLLAQLCFWYDLMSQGELCGAFLIANLFVWLILTVRQVRSHEMLTIALAICLFATILFGASFGVKAYAMHITPEGVVTAPEITVRAGTSVSDTVLFKLHEGTSFTWKEETDGWVKIELCDGKKGWVQKDMVGKVSLS
ncbi:MAG: SH3 domain-containing protein [Desulfobacterota bacterium]|nr:SH3 domain-containing protein [Thermodesulfobacteriota bacterium]